MYSASDYVHIACQFAIVGGAMECIVIMIGYVFKSIFNLLKG